MGKTVEVRDIPKQEFTGLLSGEKKIVEFCPVEFYKEIGLDESEYITFLLRPMTLTERHKIEADDNRVLAESFLWAKENNIDVRQVNLQDENKANEYVALIEKNMSLINRELRDDITRKCIVGVKDKSVKKDADGSIAKEIFENLPNELVTLIESKIREISYLKLNEKLGL